MFNCLGCYAELNLRGDGMHCQDCLDEVAIAEGKLEYEDIEVYQGRVHCPECIYWADYHVVDFGTVVYWKCNNCLTRWTTEELIKSIKLNEELAFAIATGQADQV